MVISLPQGADLHMAQLMLLPLIVSCISKIQIGSGTVPAHQGIPDKVQRAVKQMCVCVCVTLMPLLSKTNANVRKILTLVAYDIAVLCLEAFHAEAQETSVLAFVFASHQAQEAFANRDHCTDECNTIQYKNYFVYTSYKTRKPS